MVPTFITVVGAFGEAVADRLEADRPGEHVAICRVPDHSPSERDKALAWYRERVHEGLEGLLRAGAAADDAGHGRLDLILLADVAESGASLPRDLAAAASAVLREHFSVIFPPGASPEQRSVGLVVVLVTPALDDSNAGRNALRAANNLEVWHDGGPPSPILNRVYLQPRQTEVLTLSDDDVQRAVYLFVSTAYDPGLRDTSAMRRRLGPARDQRRLVDTFAIAAADVEVERLADAFAWRSALAGLSELAAQCQRRAPAHGPELDVAGWTAIVAAEAHNARDRDRALDTAECEALAIARRDVRALVDRRIGAGEGLHRFREVCQSLDVAADRLRREAADTDAWLAEPDAPPAVDGDAPDAPDRGPPPTIESLAVSAGLLATATGTAAAAVAAVALVRDAAEAAPASGVTITSSAAPVGADTTTILAWGIAVGLLIGLGWFAWARMVLRKRTFDRRDADAAPRDRGTPLDPAARAAAAIRQRRLARGALRIVEDERHRLDGLRQAVLDAEQRARARLDELGVDPDPAPAADDYGRLFVAPTRLHAALLPASVLPRLWERSRTAREDEVWATRLLDAAYPEGGHREDLPFGEGAAWEETIRDQHAMLRERGLFRWPDVGAELSASVREFLRETPPALRLGVRPTRADGTPEVLADSRELLVVIPPDARPTVEQALAENPLAECTVLAGADDLTRVVALRTAGELDVESLA